MASGTADRPWFTVFAGPNGVGKSTAYRRFLDAGYDSGEYLNPDDIARSLGTPLAGTPASHLRAGRQVIRRTRSLIASRQSLVRETTLSSREILRTVASAKTAGYRVVMVFVALSAADTTRWRIGVRVATGGHDVPRDALQRRFPRAIDNASLVARVIDVAYFLDNAGLHYRLVATVNKGTITFLEPRLEQGQSDWVRRATSGLSRAPVLKAREDALAELREGEGLSDDLQVGERGAVYSTNAPPLTPEMTPEMTPETTPKTG